MRQQGNHVGLALGLGDRGRGQQPPQLSPRFGRRGAKPSVVGKHDRWVRPGHHREQLEDPVVDVAGQALTFEQGGPLALGDSSGAFGDQRTPRGDAQQLGERPTVTASSSARTMLSVVPRVSAPRSSTVVVATTTAASRPQLQPAQTATSAMATPAQRVGSVGAPRSICARRHRDQGQQDRGTGDHDIEHGSQGGGRREPRLHRRRPGSHDQEDGHSHARARSRGGGARRSP